MSRRFAALGYVVSSVMDLDFSRLASVPDVQRALLDATAAVDAPQTLFTALGALRRTLAPLIGHAEPALLAALVPPLVSLASAAQGHWPHHARMLLVDVLQITTGDPCEAMLDGAPGSLREKALGAEGRVPALQALASVSDTLIALAGEPPLHSASETEACDSALAHLARTATWLCLLLPPEVLPESLRAYLDEEARTWARACSLLFGGAIDAAAVEAAARHGAEPPLVRAAAALRLGADDVASGRAPRAETWSVLTSLVPTFHDSWADAWAPCGLFQDAVDSAALALLSPTSRVRFGASNPERVANLFTVLLVGLDAFPDIRRHRAAWAAGLVRFAFGARCSPWPGLSEQNDEPFIPQVEELSPVEREVLDAVATKVSVVQWDYDVHHALGDVALPTSFVAMRRWLGLDPPGAINVLVSVHETGEPRVLPLGLAAQRFVAGAIAASDLAQGIVKAFTPEALVHLVCQDLGVVDARLHSAGPKRTEAELAALLHGLKMMALERAEPDAVVHAILQTADRGLCDPWDTPATPSILWEALARLLGARGEVIPLRFDEAIAHIVTEYPSDPAPVRAVLLSLPQARRDAVLVRAIETPVFRGRNDFTDLLSEQMRQDPSVQRLPKEREPNASPMRSRTW